MTQPNEAPSSDFLADDPSEDSAVRMSSGFAPASEAPPANAAYFDSVPPPGSEARRAPAHEDMAGDSTLSRYFREMATHQVMGPEEELQAAQRVEEAELDHWAALLAYLPLAETVLAQLEKDVTTMAEPERPNLLQVAELRRLLKVFKKQRSKLNAAQLREWTELCRSLGASVRLPDSDRLWMANANHVVASAADFDLIEDGAALAGLRRRPRTIASWIA